MIDEFYVIGYLFFSLFGTLENYCMCANIKQSAESQVSGFSLCNCLVLDLNFSYL